MLAGGEALASGIAGAGKSLSDSLGAMMQQRKQDNVRAKASETLFKETPELQKALNMDAETFKGLSAAEKNEMVRTGLGKLSLMQTLQQQQMQNEAQQMREVEFSKQRAAEAGFNQDVGAMQKPGLQDVLGAAAKNNQLTNPNLDNLLRALATGQEKTFTPGASTPVPGAAKPGSVVIQTGPNQFQLQEPTKDETDKEPMITLAQGEPDVLGRYPNSVRVTPSQYAKHKEALDAIFKRVPDAPSGVAGKAMPLPKTKNELKKDQAYETARGIAVWDGTKFIAK